MITLDSNNFAGPQSYDLDIEATDEGGIIITVLVNETRRIVVELVVDNPTDADHILGELKNAIEEAF